MYISNLFIVINVLILVDKMIPIKLKIGITSWWILYCLCRCVIIVNCSTGNLFFQQGFVWCESSIKYCNYFKNIIILEDNVISRKLIFKGKSRSHLFINYSVSSISYVQNIERKKC